MKRKGKARENECTLPPSPQLRNSKNYYKILKRAIRGGNDLRGARADSTGGYEIKLHIYIAAGGRRSREEAIICDIQISGGECRKRITSPLSGKSCFIILVAPIRSFGI